MKARGCPRSWQVEAVEDGRLSDTDADSFGRHAALCDVCAREVRELAVLRRVAASLPVLTSLPLERRRLRHDLLRRTNQLVLRSSRLSRVPALAAGFGVLAVVAALVFWPRSLVPSVPRPSFGLAHPVAANVPTFEMAASPGAEWRSVERGSTLRLLVKTGRFELVVDKLSAHQRFVLDLPDGELEVQGTRFIVDTDGARTLSVHVVEGRVALRLHEHPPVALNAGDNWPARPITESVPLVKAAPKLATAKPSRVERVEPVRPLVAGAGEDSDNAGQPHPPSAVGLEFAMAMSAFSAGDYGRAEQLFIAFQRSHPTDARVEDAMFVRAVAHARRGDSIMAKTVANEYLRRYPNGLRKIEAERLAR